MALEWRQGSRRAEQGDARAVLELSSPARRLRVQGDRRRRRRLPPPLARARRAEMIPEQRSSQLLLLTEQLPGGRWPQRGGHLRNEKEKIKKGWRKGERIKIDFGT